MVKETISGFIGGITGVLLSHPFDTLRVRLQSLEQKPSLFSFVGGLLKKEGFWVLYRGLVPPLFGMGLEKATVFSSYNYAKKKTDNNFVAGYVAGLTSSLIISPIEKIKINLQTSSSLTLFQVIKATIKSRTIYQGFTPTFFREAIGFGLYFSFYNFYKGKVESKTPLHYFLGGALSGCFAWCFIYPIDTIKTNAQIKKINILNYLKTHNLRTLYKGFPLALMRAFPLHGGVFLGYETAKKIIGENQKYIDETTY